MSNNYQDLTKFEFVLTLDGFIICQRFFNVRDYNPKARRSMDLHHYVRGVSNRIMDDLRIKSSNYLCENMEYVIEMEKIDDSEKDEKQNFLLEIKEGNDTFLQRIFPASVYHPKVKYTVDIRPMIKEILSDLTLILSSEELETTYLGYNL